MKKNFIFREILLYVIFFDIVLNLAGFIMGYNILEYKMMQYFGMTVRFLLDYLIMFYLWYPVRYEEYNENNVDTHILDWSLILFGECIFCTIFSNRLEKVYILLSFLLLIYIFIFYRYILMYKREYQCSESEFVTQINKDIGVILPIIGIYIFSVLGLIFTPQENIKICLLIIIYSWLLVISVFLYCAYSIKHVIDIEVSTGKIIRLIIYSIGIFLVIILGILVSQSKICGLGKMESIGIKIYFIIIELLLNLLFINKVAKIANI